MIAVRRRGLTFLAAFGLAAAGVGAARAVTTTFLPVLLDRIAHAPVLIGAVMLVNAVAGFAIPLAVGVWSDRARRRLPFLAGGAALTCGGLVAVALSAQTTYVLLALAAVAVYAGLNAVATAHRALIPDGFQDAARPSATSAQEVAMLAGAMVGIGAGGALLTVADWMPFAAAGAAMLLTAIPTLLAVVRRRARFAVRAPAHDASRQAGLRALGDVLRVAGAREVLLAQVLWVAGYVALPAFFILYAASVLGLGTGVAAALPAAFGLLTGAGMVVGGRTPPERVRARLIAGAALLGGGLVAAAPLSSVQAVAAPFAAAAVGAGLVTALGFPYFARFIPEGRAGEFSGAFFAARAVAAVVALPLAGVLIEVSGSYRPLLLQGGLALVAVAVLARPRERSARVRAPRPQLRRVAAIVPCYGVERLEAVVAAAQAQVAEVLLVDDGAPAAAAARIEAVAARPGVRLLRLERNGGKGGAVAAGTALLLAGPQPPDAIAVLDADGQHPAGRLPALLGALERADVAIGDRSADTAAMPRERRFTNRVSSGLLSLVTGRRVRDSQCGMRAFRREVLERFPLPPGRYEAESRHLRALLRADVDVTWVPIPAIYETGSSAFRPVRDCARVLVAILGPKAPPGLRARLPASAFWRTWSRRLGGLVAGMIAAGAVMPLLGPIDERAFLRLNALGDGPEWLYHALDPHTRNYILLVALALAAVIVIRSAPLGGAMLALGVAAGFSDLLLQGVYLVYDRPRPEEVLRESVMLTHDRTWAHIASFPSGHLTVTTAIVVAAVAVAPVLRAPLWGYVAVIALTRITFGAHFPADVAAGLVFGYVTGAFAVAFTHALGLLPQPAPPGPLPAWRRALQARPRFRRA